MQVRKVARGIARLGKAAVQTSCIQRKTYEGGLVWFGYDHRNMFNYEAAAEKCKVDIKSLCWTVPTLPCLACLAGVTSSAMPSMLNRTRMATDKWPR